MTNEINSLRLLKPAELLPIGSVVMVEGIQQAIMVYGRKQQRANSEDVYDYVACPYPQGHISDDTNVFFYHQQIEEVVFKGLETEGEVLLRERLKEAFNQEDN